MALDIWIRRGWWCSEVLPVAVACVARALLPAKSRHKQGSLRTTCLPGHRLTPNNFSFWESLNNSFDSFVMPVRLQLPSSYCMLSAQFRHYEYRRRLPHYQKDDRPVFVTFRVMLGSILSPQARSLTLQHCLYDSGRRYTLHAVVIMPDHVHVLFTALRDEAGWTFALPEIMKAIKGTSARSINKLTGRRGRVWQDESFDHVMRGAESLEETVEYIRQNPVRRGLVNKARRL
jgi:putative transposase